MSGSQNPGRLETAPMEVLRTGLARMESYLDECAEAVSAHRIATPAPTSTDSLERKVQLLILDPEQGTPEKESLSWLGQAVLDTQKLLASLASYPESSDQQIAKYLNAWCADTDAPEWAGKSTAERLHQLATLFCAGLEGLRDGLQEQAGFAAEPAD